MKKILIFSNHPAYTYNLRKEIITGFLEDGFKVTLVVPYGEEIEYFRSLGARIVNIEIEERSKNPIKDIKLLKDNLKILKAVKPDVVITYATKQNIYGGLAARLLKVPYIPMITGLGTAIENPGLLRIITSFLYRNGIKKAEALLVQNKSILAKIENLNMINAPVHMTPGSGVSLDYHKFKEYPTDQNSVSFIYIGRIMKDKGIYELVDAARILKKRHPEVIINVIGHGNLSEDIKMVEKADEEGYINYLRTQKDVRPYIEAAHATILPSYHEGMANVLLESAAAGRPVLASKVPGCSETFNEGETGIGFEAKSAEAVVEAVENFLSMTHDQKKKMGCKAREKMESEFDRTIILKQYKKIIEQIG